jgi:DNA helicase INO80
VHAPYSFVSFSRSGPLRRDADFVHVPYSCQNPIGYSVPELFYLDGGLVDVPREDAPMKVGTGVLAQMMNVWSAEVIQRSLYERGMSSRYYPYEASYHSTDSSWAFLKLLDCAPAHAHAIHAAPTLRRCLMLLDKESQSVDNYYPLA